ncbi:MAG TPA: M1 family aminopeptidase [Polyangiaceae bacterium]|nr:M1 family aminopeptidase [Polyangiaceae bacterium]
MAPVRPALWLPVALFAAAGGCAAPARPAPASAPAPPAGAGPRPPTPAECEGDSPVDVVDHAIDLSLRLSPPSLEGAGDVRVRARRTTDVVRLDARDLRVASIAAGGAPLPFGAADGRLCARLPRPLAPGAELTLRLAWAVPVDRDTPRFFDDQAWAGYQASAWMPTLQDPAQRATLSLRITSPPDVRVSASGRPAGAAAARDGRRTHAFVLDRPSPPFLFAFAAGRFDEAELDVDGVKLRALGPPGADLKGALAITAPMLRFLRDRTGAPPPAAEYREVFVRGDAAQEAAGMALLSADALDEVRQDPKEDWIFSHELAHQWFAWLVPCADFADFWLNEGFATFLVAAVKEQRWGRAAYDREVELWRTRSAKVHAQGRDAPVSLSKPGAPHKAPRDSELQPRGVTYSRGALVLHKLRGELGDDTFWAAIRRYVAARAGRGATTDDLRAAFEASSGRDLGPFFDRWVYAPAPDL